MRGGKFMRFMFRKKRYGYKKLIDDLKKTYDKSGEYGCVVVNEKNIPLWSCKSMKDAEEIVAEDLILNGRKCKIVNLLFYMPRSK